MPLFVIIGYDVPNSLEKRAELRPRHLERLTNLKNENRLIVAGPTPIEHGKPAMSGSLIIADFDDLASVQAWVDAEPYLDGVYSHCEVRPFVQVF